MSAGNEPKLARGLDGVLATQTRLSRVDGDAGQLWIGGYPLVELAANASFEEVLHLLWHDRLPTAGELTELRGQLAAERSLPAPTLAILEACAQQSMPTMDALRMGVDTLSLVDPDPNEQSAAADMRRVVSVVARMPVLVAAYWRLLHGRQPVEPDPEIGHAANYLYMLSGKAAHPDAVRGLETYLITVVDHGMNNSTFTARVVISTRSDVVSAVVGALGSLKGPWHGGAPGPALDMVFKLRNRADSSGLEISEEAETYVRRVVQQGDRIMGFGHRVYKVRDPRADVLGAAAEQLFQQAGDMALKEDANAVESVVVRVLEELKPGRNLQTNVEFYTALVLHGVGLEPALFTPTFAIGRVGGWTAHILEQIAEGKLIRPRAAYGGVLDREWVALEERGDGGTASS